MTLETYTGLQAEIADFLNRADLTSQIPTFIRLAESSLERKLRHWKMEKRARATISTQYADLPSDWLETVRYNIVGTRPLALISHAELMDKRQDTDNETGCPRFYALVAGEVELFPTPDASYETEMVYYSEFDRLSDSVASNWLLAKAPDAYLYGALVHSAPFLQEDARVQTWGGFYADVVAGLQAESTAASHSGTGLVMR